MNEEEKGKCGKAIGRGVKREGKEKKEMDKEEGDAEIN